MARVRRMKLGSQGLEVSAQGLVCMCMSFNGPPKPDSDMIALIHHTINSGVTLLDTSDRYGPFTNEILIGKMGELKKLIEECKIKHISLSEAFAATIRRAHAVHPITAQGRDARAPHHSLQGNDVCPIPGTTKIENFNQNIGALSVKLTKEEMAEPEAIASADTVKGDRFRAFQSLGGNQTLPQCPRGRANKQTPIVFVER
ncbi:probable aldo-keto reductase 2 [Cornus florida]|uniref:probable aldo-keto reductase 2 n=1 Tax=Cornus florida TaxID=4283 RepID=UPI00289EDBDB|nr:probable aldo-keto reductase 2 [Cornus florida]